MGRVCFSDAGEGRAGDYKKRISPSVLCSAWVRGEATRRRGKQALPPIEGSVGSMEGSVGSTGSGESLGVPQVLRTHRTLAVRPVMA